ncbi:MAG: peptidoglycan D,D-transpeptidase FtsI family protein [Lachnospiraceae bacterium]
MKNLKKSNKREIRITASFFSALFVVMIVYLCLYVKNNEQKMLNNSYNKRQSILAAQNIRGEIYDRNGETLAQTLTDENGNEMRYYPYENLFSHVVGFSTKGKTGVESIANYYLINSDIPLKDKVENDVSGKKNPGNQVYTTLDMNLQKIASDSLGAFTGAVVVSNVKTGEILAMVSKPDFNPNTVVQDWNKYVEDTDSSVLLNRATQGIYPPGSTFKIITALEYIKEHNYDINSYYFNCHGKFTYQDTTIQCYHGTNHGEEDLLTSFAKSCNSSFASIGVSLDRNAYGETLNKLLFNQKLPLDFNYSVSNLTVDDSISDDDMIQISIGQGKAQITPMHLNMITNAIANGGVLMKPQIINKIMSSDGKTITEYEAESYKTLMTKEESFILTEMMTEVVRNGTGTKLYSDTYQAAGKTGSAEYNGVKEDSHAWFTGFAPAEDPEISVTIIIEEIGSGGDYAVPIAKRIFDGYFGVR